MFKSWAQLRKFEELVKQGKMDQKTFDKLKAATDMTRLPDRIGPVKEVKKDSGSK